ncbi:uncharacterized protein LOC126976800 [Leptidea sinapis]|uniref:uncharacterized protein LOC126976800 n=1 Tax=Leptidea sinapis TaxID=189913 RepID=UPI002145A324|nr:uncharacterized protein LOC126976800 [Leptidea sinapis]
MSQINENTQYLNIIPTEIVLWIFSFLSPNELVLCREVCIRWKQIIDNLYQRDKLWRKFCVCDFPSVYKIARYKAEPGLSWHNIYRSLTLWSKLEHAKEIHSEFASASSPREEILDIQVLNNGLVGVHTRSGIFYYEIMTKEPSKRSPISGGYLRYMENDETLIFLSSSFHLFIFRKVLANPRQETTSSLSNIKMFIANDRAVYIVTLNNDVHVCSLIESKLESKFLCRFPNGIMSLGFGDHLNILTDQRHIYSIINNEPILQCNLTDVSNLLHELRKYNLLEELDWRVYFQWMYLLNHTLPHGPLRDILIIRTYCKVVFVGTTWGVLRIYYNPFINDEFDLFNSDPIKQYNFMERSDCPVLTISPIIQIDVIEVEEGHMVLVAMPKKVAVLHFSHISKEAAANTIIAYNDVQNINVVTMFD